MQLSVVVPFFNEAENVGPLVEEIHSALAGKVEFELVAVDDGSSDETASRLEALARQFPELRLVRHRHNCGQSIALISGIRAARAPWVVTLDGDGQNDPADIPRLLAERDAHAGENIPLLIAGERAKRNDNWLRRLSSRVANSVRQGLLHDDCSDTGCGLKLFPREVFMTVPHFNHLHRFLPALFKRAGGRVLNVPVNHRPRTRGSSKYGVWNRLGVGIVDLFGVRWLQSRPCRAEIEDDTP